MIVQARSAGLRLITQHEHALVAGEAALAWRDPATGERLPDEVVLAVSLHDLGWRRLDREPRWDPRSGAPFDFQRHPRDEKQEHVSQGIRRVSWMHPYAGVLVSLHHAALAGEEAAELQAAESERRDRLLALLGEDAPELARIHHDSALLRLFDNLSLFLCLTAPDADPASRPGWLAADLLRLPASETTLHPWWEDPGTLRIDPFPFEGEVLELEVAYRDLPSRRFPTAEALVASWEAAAPGRWSVRLAAGRPGANPLPGSSPGSSGRSS